MNAILTSVLSRFTSISFRATTNCQHYSVWGPEFVDPIPRKEKLQEIKESGDITDRTFARIKPALTNENSNELYDPVVTKFINYLMRRHNNRDLARELLRKTFEKVKRIQLNKLHEAEGEDEKSSVVLDPLEVFYKAVYNCKPCLRLTPVKKGGATYQVPIPIAESRAMWQAMQWLIEAGKQKERNTRFWDSMAVEMIAAANGEGRAVKRKNDLHRQCEANRAYAHFRWG